MKTAAMLATVVCVNVALALGGFAGSASALGRPSNDRIGGAKVVTALPFKQTLDTTRATTDANDAQVDETCGAPETNNSVWYKFTAGPSDTLLDVDTTGSNFAAGVIIATGTPGALTTQACGQVSAGVETAAGTTYFILAFDDAGSGGTLKIAMHGVGPAPKNDRFKHAKRVTTLPLTQTLDTTGATTDRVDAQANSSCGSPSIDHSVWYKYTAGPTATAIYADASSSSYATGVLVATGVRGALTTLACAPLTVTTPVTPGAIYYILVFDAGGGVGGTLNFHMDVAPTLTTSVHYETLVDANGVAHLRGSYACANAGPAPFSDITGQLVQIAKKTVVSGMFDAGLSTPNCDGLKHQWSATVTPAAGRFVPGRAAALAAGFVCGTVVCASSSAAVVVDLVQSLPASAAAATVTSSSTRTYLRNARAGYGTAVKSRATWGH